MKLLFCDKCKDGFRLGLEYRKCHCGNIGGRYINDRVIEVKVKDKQKSRIIGAWNGVIFGKVARGEAFIIPWDNEFVYVKEAE